MKHRMWMPSDSAERDRFRHVEVVLAALRGAGSLGGVGQGNAAAADESLAALDLAHLSADGRDPREALQAWLGGRIKALARELDPRLRAACLELRKLAFFHYYYLEQRASYAQICDLRPSSATLLPHVDALLRWWEQVTGTALSSLPPLPRHIKPAEKAIDDLLPVSSRTVGDNIRMAACRVFEIRVGRAPRTRPSADGPELVDSADRAHGSERLQSAARLLTRQWSAPRPHLVPAADLARLIELRRSLIVGAVGSGKTTLLRRIAAALCEHDGGGAALVDLREPATWAHLDQPGALVAEALALPKMAAQCEHVLASGDMTLLFDHVEFVPEPALGRLAEAVRPLPSVFVAAPAWCAAPFADLPRFDMPPPNCNLIAAISCSPEAVGLDEALAATPLGLSILSSSPSSDDVEAARHALLRLIDHARLDVASADVISQAQRLAIALALRGADFRQAFTSSEALPLLRKASDTDFRPLLLAGLLAVDGQAYRLAYPDLVRASLGRDWLRLALDLASPDHPEAVIGSAKVITRDEDAFAGTSLPELVGAVEHGHLPPRGVVDAILSLSEHACRRHAPLLRALIECIDAAWRRNQPDDPRRQPCIRDATFHLRRHAPPRMDRPIAQTLAEVRSMLMNAETSLDRASLWEAVRLADAAADPQTLDLISAFFDAHPECQADLLKGCLRVDTVGGFELFLSLLRRPGFRAASSAGYVAAAYVGGENRFSIHLLREYLECSASETVAEDPARRYAVALAAALGRASLPHVAETPACLQAA